MILNVSILRFVYRSLYKPCGREALTGEQNLIKLDIFTNSFVYPIRFIQTLRNVEIGASQ